MVIISGIIRRIATKHIPQNSIVKKIGFEDEQLK